MKKTTLRETAFAAGSRGKNEPKRISTIFDNIVNQELTAWARPLKQLRGEHLNVKEAAYERR